MPQWQGWQKNRFFRNKPKKPVFFGFYGFFSVCIFPCEITNLCFIVPDVLFHTYELNNGFIFIKNKLIKCDKKAE